MVIVSSVEGQLDGYGERETNTLTKQYITPASDEFGEWLTARHTFMVERGWRDGEMSEWDVYDDNPYTGHIVISRDNKLVFGMRLTPVAGVEHSLSWGMVADSSIHSSIDTNEVNTLGDSVWDLTRLVPGEGAHSRDGAEVIPMLFQEGFKYCQQIGSDDPTWVFALDGSMHRWLTAHGVAIEVLGKGIVGKDDNETLFGLVRPSEVDRSVNASSFVQRYWSAA